VEASSDGLSIWFIMIGLGAYHGLNPGMGWLFALSNGLQQRSARAVWVSLFPIAAGHAASVALVAAIVLAGLQFFSAHSVQIFTAALLVAFGAWKLRNYFRHPRWVGMKVGLRGLFAWSFLMATAHGAGLMVAPFLAGAAENGAPFHGHHVHMAQAAGWSGVEFSLAVAAHTLAMFVVMGLIAFFVYRFVGLSILRSAWINFDLIWAIALLAVGAIAFWGAF
jgi:hypothetical protein